MEHHPLTVIIPCKDEAHNIEACVESVRHIADEIIVADSGSSDDTVEIAQQLGGCRLIEREFINYSNFKNWAISHATHTWVLIIDADERVTDLLETEIRQALAISPQRKTPEFDAYRMRRQNYFLGRQIKHSGWNSSTVVRLFNREQCRYNNRRVHEAVDVDSGRIGRFQGKFLHYTCQDLGRYIAALNRYTSWSAEDMYADGRRAGFWGLLCRAPIRFLQLYFLRGGFLDGAAGLAVCLTMSYYTFLKYAKLWELTITGCELPHNKGKSGERRDPNATYADNPTRRPVNRTDRAA